MVTAKDCLKKYGEPSKANPWLTYWHVPKELQVNNIPKIIWCNKDLVKPFETALRNVHSRGLVSQLCTFDGCFNIRNIRGGTTPSLHSWAVAVDLNAKTNQLGTRGDMTPEFVKCFTDAGFDWGGNFKSRLDPMHFQLKSI
jgi:hypothetical protein